MKFRLLLVPLVVALMPPGAAKESLRLAEEALQAREFAPAVELLDRHLAGAEAKQADYATYLKALAMHLQGKQGDAVDACDKLLESYQESDWRRKALFLKSRALVAEKKFEEAEAIYEAEANRLFSADRKEGLARILVEFGDELGRKPGKEELDAPPADHSKALQLYTKALGLEIGRELQDEVQFKIARSHQELRNWPEAENQFRIYLKEFDPQWAGAVGSPERLRGQVRENPLPEGERWKQARFHLADVQLAQSGQEVMIVPGMRHQALRVPDDPTPHLGKLQMARQNAEDLVALLKGGDKALKSDTHWLLVRSYNLPHPSRTELDPAIEEAREFLKNHPKHPRATDTSRLIALTYRNFGRADDAIAAFGDFAKAANFTFVPEDGEVDPEIKTGTSCSETFENWTREAVFMIGQLRFQQKKYEEAVQQWREYIARFPNGAEWSQCQSGIINAQFQIGIDAVAAKDYGAARGHFDKFLQDHPLDPRARQILFTLGQIHHAKAVELEEAHEAPDEEVSKEIAGLYRKAVEEWERLVSKYPNTEESSLALYRIGLLQEEKLGELKQALATYQRLNWGSWANQARERHGQLTAHSLSARTERTFRTNEDAFIEVTSRNAEKLTLSQYQLNLEAYFRKTHGIGGIDTLDVDLIQPDKTWEVEVPDFEKFKPTTQRIQIPFEKGKPGVCVIKVTEEDFEATTLVIRSDIDIITKTSRREVLVFAQDRLTNRPAAGVSVIASDGSEVFGSGKTGKDGVFRGKFEDELKSGESVRIFASGKQGIASYNLDLSRLKLSSGLSARGYIYTEKPTYRPGETVNVRGILRDVKEGSYVVPKGGKYSVRIVDPKGRMLKDSRVKLSEFGAFDSSMVVDGKAPLGDYSIQVSLAGQAGAPVFSGSFAVQRYKLEKVKLAFEFEERVIFRGQTVKGGLVASYYWGSPAAGEMIDYTLPDGRSYSGRTDDDGRIEIEFDPSGFLPGRALGFSALAKQYNVGASDHVFLAELGFAATVKAAQDVALAGEPFDVSLTTTGADGEPVGRKLTLTVLRVELPKPDRILSEVPWINRGTVPAAEVTVEEHEVETDDKTGKAVKPLTLEKGGDYFLRVSGEDRFGQLVTSQGRIRISDDDDAVKLRFFAEGSTGKVGSELPVRLHSRIGEGLALLTFEGEHILSHKVLTLKSGYNALDLTPGHEHYPNFRIAVAAMEGRELRSAHKDFTVERELRVSVKPRKEVEEPGADAKIDLVVTDHNGKPVEAALSLALVNEALYALYPERAPSILEFFQSGARRHAEFDLGSTCGFAYVGLTRPVIKTILEEQERLERRRREEVELLKLAEMNQATYGQIRASQTAVPGGQMGRIVTDELESQIMLENGAARAPAAPAVSEPAPMDAGSIRGLAAEGGEKDAVAAPRKEVMNASRWLSPVITDGDGKATVTVPLPENTTQWRLTARGCTRETLVGEATSSLITRKDFFLELKTPVLVQEGDRMRFLAKLHNLTKFEGEVEVKLEIEGGEKSVNRQTVAIKANSVTECLFEAFEIPLAKSVKLTASSKAGEQSDTLVMDLPVRPWGHEFFASDGGVSTGNAVARMELADGREYSWRELEVVLNPSLDQALVDFALGASGSSGQADDLLAAVAALDYATAREARDEDVRMLRDRVQTLVASLTATQQDDGHWHWCGGTDLYLTCRSYWALALARQAGIPMQPDVLSKTESYLNGRFSALGTKDNDNKAIILHALSVTGKADFAHLNRIYRERASLSNNALARAAVAMINLKREDFARDLVDLLEEKVKFEGEDAVSKIAWWPGHGVTVLQGRGETTALALLAFAGVKPDSPIAEQAARLLLRERGCFRHHAPGALGPAVAALAAYHGKNQKEEADFEIEVLVNNRKVATLSSAEVSRRAVVPVPAKFLVDGENLVRFEKKGPGRYHYSGVLKGFSPELKNPDSWKHMLRFKGGGFYHDRLTYRGVPLKSVSTSPVKNVEMGQRIRVTSEVANSYSEARRQYRIRREFLPAGLLLVDGSLSGGFQHHEIGDGVITMFYSPGKAIGNISYELVAYAPGTYRVLPGTIHDLYNHGRMTIGSTREITVLAPGEESDDPYQMNRHEHYELAQLNFNDGNYEVALKHLTHLFEKHRSHYERELARMLLWIYTMDEHFDARRVVEMFEILRERHPDLTIPFDKILAVGKAYREIGEHERAWLVFRATIDSSFINDASLSAVLEDQGQFLGGIEYMEEIWREYPDTSEVVSSYFALSQQLYGKAPKAHELKAEQERRKRRLGKDAEEFDRIGLLKRSLGLLDRFQTLYPEDPLVDDAAFSMANAFFALKDYETVVTVAERFQKRHPKSDFGSSFQYMAALGHFWQLHYDEALASAAPVTEGKSKDRDYARYITAQIHHAQGTPGKAIEWYEKVKGLYPDAAEAIRYFEEEKISLEEVTTFKPGEKVELELSYRNIQEAYLQVYKVDLMKLYLREKNLSKITQVHLAGIAPESELTVELGDGKDYRDRERKITLPLEDEGAYLVICRGDNLFTSGMVLVTPLKLEIQESPAAGSLRVNVRDTVDEGYQADVHVKAIGSSDSEFRSGDTDLRGIFVAEGLQGRATVIARQEGRYAFYRGTAHLGQPDAPNQQAVPAQQERIQQLKQQDFLRNLDEYNFDMQRSNIGGWESLRRGKGGKGVEVQKAY